MTSSRALFALLLLCGLIQTRASMVHRYSFNEAPGATILKDRAGSADGTLHGGAYFNGDGQMELNGTDGYVDLPNGIISALTNATFEAWFTMTSSAALYHRFFDFGNAGAEDATPGAAADFIAFMPHAPDGTAINNSFYFCVGVDLYQEGIRGPQTELNQQYHVAIVYDFIHTNAIMYIDGQKVGAGVVHIPLHKIRDVNNWLGRSNWSQLEYFAGLYNEFRIYNTALSPAEVRASYERGPDMTLPSDAGALKDLRLEGNFRAVHTRQSGGGPVRLMADFENLTNIDISILEGVTYSSSDSNVFEPYPNGILSWKRPGRATLTARYGGKQVSRDVAVMLPLLSRYTFNEPAGSPETADVVNGYHGVLNDPNSVSGGRIQMANTAPGSFVTLPSGFLLGRRNLTVEFWTTLNSSGPTEWQRIFDFGKPGQMTDANAAYNCLGDFLFSPFGGARRACTFLARAPINGTMTSFADMDGLLPLIPTRETHVTVVYDSDESQARIYIDGSLSAVAATTHPLTDMALEKAFIGRSIWDPGVSYYNGSIDDFRIYSDALTDEDIAASFAQTANSDGPLADVAVSSNRRFIQKGDQVAVSTKASYVRRTRDVTSGSGTLYSSSNPSVATVSSDGVVKAVNDGQATITATFGGISSTISFTIFSSAPARPVHRYTFNDGTGALQARDSIGNAHGILKGTESEVSLTPDGRLQLEGGYVDLPNDLLNGLTNATIEMWVAWKDDTTGSAAERVFDFGTNPLGEDASSPGATGLFFSPFTSQFSSRFSMVRGPGDELDADAPVLETGSMTHVVITYDFYQDVCRIYFNAELRAEVHQLPIPFGAMEAVNNWVGRSNDSETLFQGELDELAIYDGILSSEDVASNFSRGPERPVTEIRITKIENLGSTLRLTVSSTGVAGRHVVDASSKLPASWNPVSGISIAPGTGAFQVEFPKPSATQFYRVRLP